MSPDELKEMIPMSDFAARTKKNRDEEIRKIFTGEDDRFFTIIGPCSADNEDSVFDYLVRLKAISEKVKDKYTLFQEYIQTSHVQQVKGTKE